MYWYVDSPFHLKIAHCKAQHFPPAEIFTDSDLSSHSGPLPSWWEWPSTQTKTKFRPDEQGHNPAVLSTRWQTWRSRYTRGTTSQMRFIRASNRAKFSSCELLVAEFDLRSPAFKLESGTRDPACECSYLHSQHFVDKRDSIRGSSRGMNAE